MSKRFQQEADLGIPDDATTLPSDVPNPTPTTGTVDDDDAPADEHDNENEAPLREMSENVEASQEFQHDDEDRDTDA